MIELKYSIDELDIIVSDKIIPKIKNNILCLEGRMGSGKTTFIKSICTNLNVVDKISSPTFSLINEYKTINGDLIYHFDFYRIENKEEALNLGVEEYFYSPNLCLIEWASKIETLIPENKHKLNLDYIDNKHRKLIFS
ncbi:MAG: tRNA (adenosine(37)-N6)-threonylcarbamoyltransferase complex ATPase subunit type 1 TsaE [Flavobacteriaceae bacterium]|nr:tRNA (adenosine(37)-N6)-threonylcarbamoyltransferase complex ATPase subunit type 1 TsaE [Flavobacteriaceae bacterium]|tara:strand:- start:1885 stop:2298 length:414 start_codon:yes stop_codon:yes gene_type:complete